MRDVMKFENIWAALGILIGAAGLIITIYNFNYQNRSNELSIVPLIESDIVNGWLPNEKFKIVIENQKQDLENLEVNYFLIFNNSKVPITSIDFIEPITVSDLLGDLVTVDSCSEKFHEACFSDNQTYPKSAWIREEDDWALKPLLINRDEGFCIAVVSKKNEGQTNKIKFQGRIKNFKLISYSSAEEYSKKHKNYFREITRHMNAMKMFGNFIALLLFIFLMYLLAKSETIPPLNFEQSLYVGLIGVICVAISEIFIHISLEEPLHYHDYLAIIFASVAIAILSYRAYWKNH